MDVVSGLYLLSSNHTPYVMLNIKRIAENFFQNTVIDKFVKIHVFTEINFFP